MMKAWMKQKQISYGIRYNPPPPPPPSTWLSGCVMFCFCWSGCIIKNIHTNIPPFNLVEWMCNVFWLKWVYYEKNTYPSHIFLTLVLSWSPWKKIMKTVLFTSSPCKHMVASLHGCPHNWPFASPLMTCRYSSQRPSNAKIRWLSVWHKFVPKGPTIQYWLVKIYLIYHTRVSIIHSRSLFWVSVLGGHTLDFRPREAPFTYMDQF